MHDDENADHLLARLESFHDLRAKKLDERGEQVHRAVEDPDMPRAGPQKKDERREKFLRETRRQNPESAFVKGYI